LTPLSGTLSSSQPSYDFDTANPGITIEMYGNDTSEDCVIAARAHHTIRLTYVPGVPILNISPEEITEEYTREAHGGIGIDLRTSLVEWEKYGWKAGGIANRTIQDFAGPFSVNGAGLALGDPTNDWSQAQIMNSIFADIGVQAQLRLPRQIRVDDTRSYGPGNLWKDTTRPRFWAHVMLLTGYDTNGPIGITWGKKQAMTWDFLKQYCLGVFRVVKGPRT
jgi:hypothetical protein